MEGTGYEMGSPSELAQRPSQFSQRPEQGKIFAAEVWGVSVSC